MFGTILISIITLMHVYVFWRITTMQLVLRYVPKRVIVVSGLILWIVFFAGRKFGHGCTGVLASSIEFLGMNWMGVVFLLFLCLLAADIITVFGLVLPRVTPFIRVFALFFGIIISVIALIQGMRPPVVKKYDVYLPGLPEKLNDTALVAIADTHLGSLIGKNWLKSRISQIQKLKPDIIVLLGDIHEGHGSPQEESLPLLKNLNAPMGVWSVLGNHEFHRHSDKSISLLANASNLLRNKWVELQQGFILAGVDDLSSHRRRKYKGDTILETLEGTPKGASILLSHSPLEVEKASKLGVDLMISGHTHGGQIWPFSYIVKQRYPMIAGRYEVNDMTLIVTRGAGTWGPRMRLWHAGEILYIKLYTKR